MCYDVEYLLQRRIKEAKKKEENEQQILFLEDKLERLRKSLKNEFEEHHWVMGFSHQPLPCITNEQPEDIQLISWGLIPFWVKNKKDADRLSNQCLNARGETIFEKPSFRAAAKNRRCLVVLSGYYEHHWLDPKGKTKIPYYITRKDRMPMYMAGLWEEWLDKETGELKKTCTMVTTGANKSLAKVHNRNPDDPRMLTIIPDELKHEWLLSINDAADIKRLKALIQTYPDDELEIYPVAQLRGKNGVGDTPDATKKKEYHLYDIPLFQ
jgi:putative SOS response-associated peptidase YedK